MNDNFSKKAIAEERPCWSSTPEETRRKISEANKGKTPWNKGKKLSEARRKRGERS